VALLALTADTVVSAAVLAPLGSGFICGQ
jgi:hypothetical protein